MPVERRGRSPTLGLSQLATGGAPTLDGRRQPSFGGTSRMTRECQVRICERLGVKFPGPTRQPDIVRHDQLLFLGDALMPGARPGLICSGVGTDFGSSTGSDAGVARSVVVAGMHPGRAGGPSSTSKSRVTISATARS